MQAKRRGHGELQIIEEIRLRAGKNADSVRLGIGDDCAILTIPKGHEALVTTDLSIEGRHFRRDWHPAGAVGHRTLARGLSDLAAMGASPVAAFLSLGLPEKSAWLKGFLDGFFALAERHKVTLAGGDTAQMPGQIGANSGIFVADITLIGSIKEHFSLRRSGARVGHGIYVTGALGGAAGELDLLAKSPKTFARAKDDGMHPHLFPEPRLAVGQKLAKDKIASACIDVSDGISTELMHLAKASGVGMAIEAELVPLHPLARGLEDALNGGEDYELLFTSSKTMPKSIAGVAITRIGTVTRAKGLTIREGGKKRVLEARGWEHFRA